MYACNSNGASVAPAIFGWEKRARAILIQEAKEDNVNVQHKSELYQQNDKIDFELSDDSTNSL